MTPETTGVHLLRFTARNELMRTPPQEEKFFILSFFKKYRYSFKSIGEEQVIHGFLTRK
jgi:hypothetical protein